VDTGVSTHTHLLFLRALTSPTHEDVRLFQRRDSTLAEVRDHGHNRAFALLEFVRHCQLHTDNIHGVHLLVVMVMVMMVMVVVVREIGGQD